MIWFLCMNTLDYVNLVGNVYNAYIVCLHVYDSIHA